MDQEYDAKAADKPHYMTGAEKGTRCYFYVEGNPKDGPKMILVNTKIIKNHQVLLDRCSEKVGYAVERLVTPKGGTSINKPGELRDEKFYIACKNKKVQLLQYDSNRIKRPFLVSTGSPRRIDSFKTDQIAPSKTFPDVKPRFHDTTQYNACRIHLAENGNIKKGCKPFTFSPSKESLENIIGRICKEKNTNCNHLIDCDTEQTVIDIKDLKHGQKYVMVSKLPDFVPGDYSLGKEKDISAPRYVHHSLRKGYGYPRRPRTLQPIGHTTNASPHSSVASHPQTRKRETRQERNGGIQTRPVKHNHVSDKDGRGGAYSDRDNGVFKAKSQNQHTKGAKEVGDSKDTRVDLPIDQVTAEEVEEERIRNEGNRTDRQPAKAKRGTNSKTVPNSKKATDTKKETTHKTNSKTNPTPKVADHSHHGGGGNLDTQKTKHSGTRGDFNNVSPLPPISKQNNEKRTSSPAPNDRRKSQAQKENEAATTIQANFKGYKTRQELQKQKTEMKANDASASKTDNKQDTKKKEEDNKKKVDDAKKKEDEEQNKAATKIQAGFRGHQTRKDLAKQKEDVAKVNKQSNKPQNSKGSYNEEEMAATRIQANYRGYKTRKSINQKKNTKTQNNKEMDENAAATKIQANYRGHRARQDLKQKEKEEENKAATKIQANYRGHKARKDVKQQKEEAEAATKIQATFRGHKTRKELKNQTKQKES